VAYTAIGICGYGLFGEDTADNILLNLRSPPLDAAMTLYQCLCFPPTFHSLRYTLDSLADGADAPRPSPVTHVARVATLLVGAMAVAALLPHSELLFALTGAVGVCAVCYALPVLMHLRLPGPPRSGGGGGGGVGGGGGGGGGGGTMLRYAVPVAALSGGMCLSALGLYSTLS
jgi:amino acid permease